MDEFNFIKCPCCNYQYLPGEIFNPKHFLGQPKSIIRNNIGEILGYEGLNMDTNESYICENCNTEFNITTKINFTTSKISDDVDEENKPKIRKISLF